MQKESRRSKHAEYRKVVSIDQMNLCYGPDWFINRGDNMLTENINYIYMYVYIYIDYMIFGLTIKDKKL